MVHNLSFDYRCPNCWLLLLLYPMQNFVSIHWMLLNDWNLSVPSYLITCNNCGHCTDLRGCPQSPLVIEGTCNIFTQIIAFLIVSDCQFITCNFLGVNFVPLSFINLSIAWSHMGRLAYLMVTKKLWKLTVVKCHASCQHRLVQLVRIWLRSHKDLGANPAANLRTYGWYISTIISALSEP